MAFNFLDRLGSLFGGRTAAPETPTETPAEAASEAPTDAAAETPPADTAATEPYAPDVPYTVTEEVVVAQEATPAPAEEAVEAYSPPVDTPTPAPMDTPVAAPEPAPEPVGVTVEEVAVTEAAPAEPAKSAEEQEEERLWGEIDGAWSTGEFSRVTELLDALKAYQPEDAVAIDEKIAAAQYNEASALEQSGELDRALYLYQEAQRRNPNLGEAAFAIERVQAALAPPPEAAPEPEAAPAEQTYTVESGDTLSAIAERFYGDPNQWPRIFEANGDQLDNPDLIQPGQVLRIPA